MEYISRKFVSLTKMTYKGFPRRSWPKNFEFPEQQFYKACKNDYNLWSEMA